MHINFISEQTVKCHICGRPYKVHSHYAGDQSACPKCIAEATAGDHKSYWSDNTGGSVAFYR